MVGRAGRNRHRHRRARALADEALRSEDAASPLKAVAAYEGDLLPMPCTRSGRSQPAMVGGEFVLLYPRASAPRLRATTSKYS